MRTHSTSLAIFFGMLTFHTSWAFQSFNLQLPKINVPQLFPPSSNVKNPSRQQQESILIEKISNTQFGKTATVSEQRDILQQVASLETNYPSPPLADILASGQIDGTWFLQFTCPSKIDDDEEEESEGWTIENAEENITTKRYNAKGSVSAGGINVDVSLKPPKQIFDLSQNTVVNEVVLPNAFVRVGGPFRLSENNEKRAVVAFKECKIDLLDSLIKLDLGFLFTAVALATGTADRGWLETTYLSDTMRIGRGNKGSMFVLTRDEDSVAP